MQAVQFITCGKNLQLVQLDVPKIEDDKDILIKVAYAGICGTDVHIIDGAFPCKQDGPITLGHELSGIVVDVGKKVATIKKGDRVSVDPNKGCHHCNFCSAGSPHFCDIGYLTNTIGIYRNGGWAGYVTVSEEQTYKLPDKVTLKQAALCEPISCLVHSLDIISPIPIGKTILVMGAGIIGNLLAAILHFLGHRNVTVSEPNSTRIEFQKQMNTGFDCITPATLKSLYESNPDYRFDFVIDCSGNALAMQQAVVMMRPGGKMCIFGVASPDAKIQIAPYDLFRNELTIVGTKINPFTFPKAISLIESMGERYIDYKNLGIRTFKLNQYKSAVDELRKGSIAKATFEM